MFGGGVQEGFYTGDMGISMSSPFYRTFRDYANTDDPTEMAKAFVTDPATIVQPGDTGGRSMRMQFLRNTLEYTSFNQTDAALMREIPKEKVWENTFEWTVVNQYGTGGSGFIPETGGSSSQTSTLFFGMLAGDDSFNRLVKSIRYMATVRFISEPALRVRNIENPVPMERRLMTLEIIGKSNRAGYWGNSRLSTIEFDGMEQQLKDWLTAASFGSNFAGNPADQAILYDAGGSPLGKDQLSDIQVQNGLLYGQGDLMLMSITAKQDTNRLLFPEARYMEGLNGGAMGVNKNEFVGDLGTFRLVADKMLRPNRPLAVDGPSVTGGPKTTADAGMTAAGIAFTGSSGPWAATNGVVPAATTPGSGVFWRNANLNTDTAVLFDNTSLPNALAPALPSGAGNQGNRMAAGSYYYAVSLVYNGFESLPWVYGSATAAGTLGTPTAVTVTATNSIVSMSLAMAAITGLTSVNYNQVYFRVYRYGGPSAVAPTAISQFVYLGDVGLWNAISLTTGVTIFVDNGYHIPGTDEAFLITTTKQGRKEWMMAQLLPMLQIPLPRLLLAIPLGLLAFQAIILLNPRHCMHIRNIGRP